MKWLHELIGEMAAHGLGPADGVSADGNLHRFRVEADKPGSRNGWYVVHDDDYPTAVFGSWKTGEQHTWRASGPSHDTSHNAHQRARVRAEQQRRQAEETKTHADAAAHARRIWDQALDPDPRHRYLRGKAVGAYGIRQHQDALVVPLKDITGKLQSLQFITADGQKRFLRGGRVKGLFHVIGKRTPQAWLCEGYATGASLREDRKECVIVAFNCSNLLPVAETIQRNWRPLSLTLMADDDWQTSGNPGVKAAREVSERLGLDWYTPEFPPSRPAWATDFNDSVRLWLTTRKGAA